MYWGSQLRSDHYRLKLKSAFALGTLHNQLSSVQRRITQQGARIHSHPRESWELDHNLSANHKAFRILSCGRIIFLFLHKKYLHLTLQSKKIKLDPKSLIKEFKFNRKCVRRREGKEPRGVFTGETT